MQNFSLLDLSPVPEGHSTAEALSNTVELAKLADRTGYHRFWLAEHHNMPGIASAATSVVIGHVANATENIRVGAGGIMLPNHAPLMVAEQFGTLATLFPDRIDLGLGRAPGTDMTTTRALRRNTGANDRFPQDVQELLHYFGEAQPGQAVRAIPGEGTRVPIWILGSSLYGAQLAAHFGLPYAFASHFAPAMLEQALRTYRETFQPSEYLDKPHFMLAAGVCIADTDEEAEYLRSSQKLAFARLRSGNPGKLPKPSRDIDAQIPAEMKTQIAHATSCSAVGSPETAESQLRGLIETYQPDEMIITGMIHDHSARLNSFKKAAEILGELRE